MIRDTIRVVADNPVAGVFVIICALVGLDRICLYAVEVVRAWRGGK